MTKQVNVENRMRYAEAIIRYRQKGYQKTYEGIKETVMAKGKAAVVIRIKEVM